MEVLKGDQRGQEMEKMAELEVDICRARRMRRGAR